MKKKAFFVFFVILIVVVLDLINRAFCTYAFAHVQEDSRIYYQHIYHLNNRQSDILIAGASCANHSYISQMIEDSLHMTCFNVGQDGRNISFQYMCIKKALMNGKVKIVLLDLGTSQLSSEWVNRYEYYQTYYWQNQDAKVYMDEVAAWYNPIKMASSFIQYNNKFFVAVYNFLPMGTLGVKGYVPLPYTREPFTDIVKADTSTFRVASYGIEYLDKTIELCKRNNVKLILCSCPKLSVNQSFINYIAKYAEKNGLEFWDYSNLITDRKLMKDSAHINDKGAQIYTETLISRLKTIN